MKVVRWPDEFIFSSLLQLVLEIVYFYTSRVIFGCDKVEAAVYRYERGI